MNGGGGSAQVAPFSSFIYRRAPAQSQTPTGYISRRNHQELQCGSPFLGSSCADPELARFTPQFEARLDDLGQLSNEALQANPEGHCAVHQLISYISFVTKDLDFEELSQHLRQAIPETEELVMTIAEKLRQEGEQRGIDKGLRLGEYQGYRKLVRRQIELKFGTLDADDLARLEAADEATLVRFGDRVLTATSIEDVLRGPQERSSVRPNAYRQGDSEFEVSIPLIDDGGLKNDCANGLPASHATPKRVNAVPDEPGERALVRTIHLPQRKQSHSCQWLPQFAKI